MVHMENQNDETKIQDLKGSRIWKAAHLLNKARHICRAWLWTLTNPNSKGPSFFISLSQTGVKEKQTMCAMLWLHNKYRQGESLVM